MSVSWAQRKLSYFSRWMWKQSFPTSYCSGQTVKCSNNKQTTNFKWSGTTGALEITLNLCIMWIQKNKSACWVKFQIKSCLSMISFFLLQEFSVLIKKMLVQYFLLLSMDPQGKVSILGNMLICLLLGVRWEAWYHSHICQLNMILHRADA